MSRTPKESIAASFSSGWPTERDRVAIQVQCGLERDGYTVVSKAEIDRLRAALRPFANQAKEWADCAAHDKVLVMLCKPTWNDPEKIQESPQVGAITMGDFRRAIAALASEQKAGTTVNDVPSCGSENDHRNVRS